MTLASIKKMLVAIDGSDRSIKTVKYLADMAALRNAEINLFHVFSGIPESHYDLLKEPASLKMGGQLVAWESAQRKRMEKYMEKCRKILLAADFHPQRVSITVRDRKHGIARDIVAASHTGYDAVVLRRRGMSRLTGLVMGSVAYKLLNTIDSVPLIFAGRKSYNQRILIGMDQSENAMRAVDFVGRMADGYGYEVLLVNVMRGLGASDVPLSVEAGGYSHGDVLQSEIHQIFATAIERLVAAGFDPQKVRAEIIRDVPSRAGALVEMADREDYSTIVVGRRGLSRTSAFAIGRVSPKVLQIGRKHHVWIVN
jgi:nucleotide-binding universal stress UspA family protein